MEYCIVTRKSRAELIEAVNAEIKEGWEPTGGVTSTVYKTTKYDREDFPKAEYSQAMVKRDYQELTVERIGYPVEYIAWSGR